MKFEIAFGQYFEWLMKSKGLTAQDVAAKANIEAKQVYRIINAEHSARLSTIILLAKGMGVHPKELFNFDFGKEHEDDYCSLT